MRHPRERPDDDAYCGGRLQVTSKVEELKELGQRRYVGDSSNNLVHDTWHADCEGCGLDEIVGRGDAVGFTPDTLDGALWAGYEYCEACHDRTEPPAPPWAAEKTAPAEPAPKRPTRRMRTPAPRPGRPN